MAQGISTEWEDIHVKLGNYLPRNKSPTLKELDEANLKVLQLYIYIIYIGSRRIRPPREKRSGRAGRVRR